MRRSSVAHWLALIAFTFASIVGPVHAGLKGIASQNPGSVAITGGTITGTNVPYVLAQSAIPFIHLSSGSVSAAGAISGITALPVAYASAYCYFPANALATAIAAGWYYCTFSTTTAGTAFLNTYTSGAPTIPSSPTAVTDGKGAFTGVTTAVNGPAITLPAGAMGANGAVRLSVRMAGTNNANNKSVQFNFGATQVSSAINIGNLLNAEGQFLVQNRGVQNSQLCSANQGAHVGIGTTTGSRLFTAVDTSAAVTINVNFSVKGTATDNLIVEGFVLEVMYGA